MVSTSTLASALVVFACSDFDAMMLLRTLPKNLRAGMSSDEPVTWPGSDFSLNAVAKGGVLEPIVTHSMKDGLIGLRLNL